MRGPALSSRPPHPKAGLPFTAAWVAHCLVPKTSPGQTGESNPTLPSRSR
jgi:hypothetical protein